MLKKWSILLLIMGLFLVLSPLGAQARPYPPYGKAYGWHGHWHHAFNRHHRYFRGPHMGPHHRHAFVRPVYVGPPPVAYVRPVIPVVAIQPLPQPQPIYSPPAPPGIHGQITF